jgi:hypothetical protein
MLAPLRLFWKINMTSKAENLYPQSAKAPSNRQIMFMRYFTAILIDLVVLNLFVEFLPQYVVINSFVMSLAAAVLLQVLLKATLAVEHRVAAYWNTKSGAFPKFMRYFCAWLVIFGSKFVILEALALAFGKEVFFGGPLHGLVVLIIVIVIMLIAEEAIVRLYRRLA